MPIVTSICDFPRRWTLAVRAKRTISRCQIRPPFHYPVLDVRDADSVPQQLARYTWKTCSCAQPDGGCGRRLSLGSIGCENCSRTTNACVRTCSPGCLNRGRVLFSQDGEKLRGRRLSFWISISKHYLVKNYVWDSWIIRH